MVSEAEPPADIADLPAAPEPAVRPASTVMLLREGQAGLEVFVLHRVAGMAFAPSVTVFPGGGVDPSDHLPPDWSGPDRTWWANALGKEPAEASALVVAAARELFEETGVLLAGAGLGEPVRLAVAEHRRSLRDVMVAGGLELRSDLLRPWANWITPPGNTRRYDTFFFLAAQPEGQEARMLTTEAESGRWARPVDLLAQHEAGRLAMMPPTLAMLMDLQQAGTLQGAMGQNRAVTVRTPSRSPNPLWTGRVRGVTSGVSVLLADNPGPMTLEGTNSYLLGGPESTGSAGSIVVDPGPDDEDHLQALAGAGPVELVLITHRHADHTAGARRFGNITGAPVRAADPAHCHGGGAVLIAGEEIRAAGLVVRVVATPGHTRDSVSFHLPGVAVGTGGTGPGAVLTGDTILGRGTTVIAYPDGDLGSYLESLDTLAGLGAAMVLPAHGPPLPDLAAICNTYYEHRQQRLDSVRAALLVLGDGATVGQVTDLVYTDIDVTVRPAAELSVAAQLQYLRGPA